MNGYCHIDKGALGQRCIARRHPLADQKLNIPTTLLSGACWHLHEKEVLFGPLAHLRATFSASLSASLNDSPNLPKTTLSDRRARIFQLLSGSPLLVDQLVSALDVLVLELGLDLGTRGLGFESQRVNYCHSPFLKYFYCLGLKNALN